MPVMEEKVLHVYIELDLLKYLAVNNFKNDTDYNPHDLETVEVSGLRNATHSFRVKFIGIKTFRQLGSFEVDGRAQVSMMVFSIKRRKDKGVTVLTVLNGKREVLQVDTLRNLCFAIPRLVRKHVSVSQLIDRNKLYKMDSNPRGLCIIINNKNFADRNGNTLRHGTDVDSGNLRTMFDGFGLEVKTYTDLNDCEIVEVMKRVSLMNHSDCDVFVCCILSHGSNGSVLGVNNNEVPILELTSMFRNRGCSTLSGKPKVFFIQACQGQSPQRGVIQQDVCVDEEHAKLIPDGSDFLVACSSEPGYESFRHSVSGSYFINSLVKQLKPTVERSLTDILTDVCSDVASETFYNVYKQVPSFSSTLTKTLIFK